MHATVIWFGNNISQLLRWRIFRMVTWFGHRISIHKIKIITRGRSRRKLTCLCLLNILSCPAVLFGGALLASESGADDAIRIICVVNVNRTSRRTARVILGWTSSDACCDVQLVGGKVSRWWRTEDGRSLGSSRMGSLHQVATSSLGFDVFGILSWWLPAYLTTSKPITCKGIGNYKLVQFNNPGVKSLLFQCCAKSLTVRCDAIAHPLLTCELWSRVRHASVSTFLRCSSPHQCFGRTIGLSLPL